MLTKEERSEIEAMCEALNEAGVPIPDKNDTQFLDDAGGGCKIVNELAWFDEISDLYDCLA